MPRRPRDEFGAKPEDGFDDSNGAAAGPAERPSRSERKRASSELQSLGDELVGLPDDVLAGLALPERLRDEVDEAKRLESFGARRRQSQFIGKLMRRLDAATVEAIRGAVRARHAPSAAATAELHRAERWRDALLADDDALERWVAEFGATEAEPLRALIAEARRDAGALRPGEAPRRGPAYRRIFALVRARLAARAE